MAKGKTKKPMMKGKMGGKMPMKAAKTDAMPSKGGKSAMMKRLADKPM